MEILGGSRLVTGSTMKRKRSRVSRRPRADSDALFQSYFGWLSHVEPSGNHTENENVGDAMIASDGLGTDNKLKKLKLKFGGVTHTIHAKSKTETGFSSGSFVTNFSPCSDGPKPRVICNLTGLVNCFHQRFSFSLEMNLNNFANQNYDCSMFGCHNQYLQKRLLVSFL